ncbi:hypothetical protein DAA61_01455 [Bradyrhizobium sp. WBAH33]|nr:hypothetical protein [Bradyrhizobium sp. WBAH30]MDD1547064.1 hypothetical protein [Bradyrhizobium sp. WBAH41]QCJ87317.1 hypothetical protein DAA57_01380 [Bradyrhizobium yuanmingense]QCJ94691.1 hypothetical protein DAA61_01455 [Bradyrhizobium sp. WBAH33]QCK02056.1 hypothetical protein DAB18_01460 [Bradyrhizobium sp. WBAH41]
MSLLARPPAPIMGLALSGNEDWKRETIEMARPAPSTMTAYHVNIVHRNAAETCGAKFNLGEDEVPGVGNRGLK